MSDVYTACGYNVLLSHGLTVYCDKKIDDVGKHVDGTDTHHVGLLIEDGTGRISQA